MSDNKIDLKMRISDLEEALRMANTESEAMRDEVQCLLPNCYVLRFFVKFSKKNITKNSTKPDNTPLLRFFFIYSL